MTMQEDFQLVQQHLRKAADPLVDAAQLFVETNPDDGPVFQEEVEIVGQAILTSLMSLNMALESLIKINAAIPRDAEKEGTWPSP